MSRVTGVVATWKVALDCPSATVRVAGDTVATVAVGAGQGNRNAAVRRRVAQRHLAQQGLTTYDRILAECHFVKCHRWLFCDEPKPHLEVATALGIAP